MVEVAIADPLTDGTIYGFVYLFVSEKIENTGTYALIILLAVAACKLFWTELAEFNHFFLQNVS